MDPLHESVPTFLLVSLPTQLKSSQVMAITHQQRGQRQQRPVRKAINVKGTTNVVNVKDVKVYNPDKYIEVCEIPKQYLPEWQEAWSLQPDNFDTCKIGGKEPKLPRKQKNYLFNYKYGGVLNLCDPTIPACFLPLMNYIRDELHIPVNGLLVNWYEYNPSKGLNHYIGAHSDKTDQLVPGSCIVTVTMGEPYRSCISGDFHLGARNFDLVSKDTNKVVKSVRVENGTCVTMKGGCQKRFKHKVDKVNEDKDPFYFRGSRMSFTFRCFKCGCQVGSSCDYCDGQGGYESS